MIEAQNKSCNLGYTTVSALFVHLYYINPPPLSPREREMNWKRRNLESELYVFSQATKNFLNS